MKISEAMTLIDEYTGTPIDESMKYLWLQDLEDLIYKEIILTHEDPGSLPAAVNEGDRELLCEDPYSEVYIHYMNMQNDLLLRDTYSYANSSAAFYAVYGAYADYYNRTHQPLSPAEVIKV